VMVRVVVVVAVASGAGGVAGGCDAGG
jgi:hypothetical protein